ncbi:PqiA/YebS family transporter subunit [Marinomonas sp. TI.3.20]|uniref:PqiA/YebS family transporter subunit n=1 Tax=Marinomonas sp. TI.3.20 TaxID=3121296 RepID=UPI00311EE5CF
MGRYEFEDCITVCDECDLVNRLPELKSNQKLRCTRCHHILIRLPKRGLEKILAYGSVALLMLVLSLSLPFLSLTYAGMGRTVTFWQSLSVLLGESSVFLGALIVFALLVLPASYLLSAVVLSWSIKKRKYNALQRCLLQTVIVIKPWLMIDVFLVGALVALVKMQTIATVEIGLSFWAFCIYVFCLFKTGPLIDRRWLWYQVAGPVVLKQEILSTLKAISSRSQGMAGCHFCGAITSIDASHCGRCCHKIYSRKPASIKVTVALLVVALMMFIVANLLPIMQTTFLGMNEPSTIVGGVYQLWGIGSYAISIIILLASIFIPLAKMLSLGWLCWQASYPNDRPIAQKLTLYRITKVIGRWSMMDIFVVVILTGLIQVGGVISIVPGSAALSFASVVILTMLAAMTFDSRLLLDQE